MSYLLKLISTDNEDVSNSPAADPIFQGSDSEKLLDISFSQKTVEKN